MANTFLGVSPTVLATGLAILTGGILLMLSTLGVMNPFLLQVGLRNIIRRPGQTAVMLCGLTLSTLFIITSLGLNDSFVSSLATYRAANMGNVDESVTGHFTANQVTQTLAHIRQHPEVEAATALYISHFATRIFSSRTGLSIANVDVYAVPSDFDQVFGQLTDTHGHHMHFADLNTNELFISTTLAQNFDVQAGDTLQLEIGAKTIPFSTHAILSNDLAVTAGELSGSGSYPEVILPLSTFQRIYEEQTHIPAVADIICIKNKGQGGLDDIGPGGSRSKAVLNFLQQLFGVAPINIQAPFRSTTFFYTTLIHPLKPDVLNMLKYPPFITSYQAFSSPATQEFYSLLPIFTCLLVGVGMLLTALLLILLATERRAELGMSRAVGLQRSHIVQTLLIESCGYSIVAAILGVLLGIGAIALELTVFSSLPALAPGADAGPLQSIRQIPYHLAVSWQSVLSAGCLGVLTTVTAAFITALWISRMNIVAAIRNLDNPPALAVSLLCLIRTFWSAPLDAAGQQIPETPAQRFYRKTAAIGGSLATLVWRGPLCLLVALCLLLLASRLSISWMMLLGNIVLIACLGLFVNWLLPLLNIPGLSTQQTRRLGISIIGLGWLIYGMQLGNILLQAFVPNPTDPGTTPPLADVLLSNALPVIGVVILLMTNIDGPVFLLSLLARHIRGFVPISRLSLVYPLTFRFRTGVTITLLSFITFLIVSLVTNNLTAIQQAQSSSKTGNFQLSAGLGEPELISQIQANNPLSTDFAAIAILRPLFEPPNTLELSNGSTTSLARLLLPDHTAQKTGNSPTVADNTFLSTTTMPMIARAQGYSSDRQVWNAVKDQPDLAVLRYDTAIAGLPASSGFTPFYAEVPDSSASTAHFHRVTIIGIVSVNTQWADLYISQKTAVSIVHPPVVDYTLYLFRIAPGKSIIQVEKDLNRAFNTSYAIQLETLDAGNKNAYTAGLTLFLGSYLALGLLFGALAIGVIVSRAVVERRQQIGMLRALGFPHALIRRMFLLEASFVITLGLLAGTILAFWLAFQIAHVVYQQFSLPVGPIILILLSSYLIAFFATILPAQRASRLPPAEALRYE